MMNSAGSSLAGGSGGGPGAVDEQEVQLQPVEGKGKRSMKRQLTAEQLAAREEAAAKRIVESKKFKAAKAQPQVQVQVEEVD
jgi:hypothetical protein